METTTLPAVAVAAARHRGMTAISVGSICVLAALAIAAFSTDQAMGGGLAERAVIPGRMLLLVLAATLFLRFMGESWTDIGLRKPQSYWKTGALVLGGYFGIGLMYLLVGQLLLPALGLPATGGSLFSGLRGDLAEYLYWLIPIAWGSAALGEELVFRGFLQTRFECLFRGIWGAALLALLSQAFIFGALHAYQGAGGAILAGGTGLVIGMIYIAAGRNLWAPIILHGLVDTVALTAIFLGAAGGAP